MKTEDFPKLKNKLTVLFDRQEIFPWPWFFADQILTKEIGELADGKICSVVVEEFRKGHIYHNVDRKEIDDVGKVLLQKIVGDKNFYKNIIDKIYELSDDLIEFSKKIIEEDYREYSNEKLFSIIEEYVGLLKRLRFFGWVPALIDGLNKPLLSNLCIESLQKDLLDLKDTEINHLYSVLVSPDIFGQVQRSEIDKYKLILEIGEELHDKLSNKNYGEASLLFGDKLNNAIVNYVNNYSWVTYNYEGPALTVENFWNDIVKISYDDAKKQLQEIEKNKNDTEKEKVALLEKYKLSNYTKDLLKIASDSMIIKEYRKSVYQNSYVAIDKPLEEVSRRLNTTLKSIKFLGLHELFEVITLGKMKEGLLERQDYCVVVLKNGEATFYGGNEAREIVDHYVEKDVFNQKDSFTGQVAYSGEVKGKAKIIMTVRDLSKMNEGDVLISSSTNPDLLPAMKKAGAIVTDFGGVICHAAIVSRELKIPCVVGTHDISKHVKDNDLLYVDANKGVVTRLKN